MRSFAHDIRKNLKNSDSPPFHPQSCNFGVFLLLMTPEFPLPKNNVLEFFRQKH